MFAGRRRLRRFGARRVGPSGVRRLARYPIRPGGKTARSNLRNIGDGVLAAWAAQFGQEMGEKVRAEGGGDELMEGFGMQPGLAGHRQRMAGEGLSAMDLASIS